MLKQTIKKFIPAKCYNFLRMRPKIVVISSSLWRQIKEINVSAWTQDPDNRGDVGAALRKLGHILDKGLQSIDREPGHSLNIADSLSCLLAVSATEEIESVQWGKLIHDYHSRLQLGNLPCTEYHEFDYKNNALIDYSTLFSFLKERRSIRHFDFDKMPHIDDIRKVLKGGIWAPSSCNRQTITTLFTCNEDLAMQCLKQNKGATSITGKFAFVCVCYDTRSYHLPQESLTGLIDVSLGFQNCLMLVHTLGLGACVLNWSHSDSFEEENLRNLLSIPEYYSIAFNVIIGIPRYGAPVPAKKTESKYIIER